MPNIGHLSLRVAYARIPHDLSLDGLAEVVAIAGGRLTHALSVPEVGRMAVASGIDSGTLALLAALAPTDSPSPN